MLLLNSQFDNIFRFDTENQQMVTDDEALPPELEPFVDSNGVFQCTKYCLTFAQEIHRVITEGSMPLPPGRTILTYILNINRIQKLYNVSQKNVPFYKFQQSSPPQISVGDVIYAP